MIQAARSLLFYLGLVIVTVLWGSFATITGKFVPKLRRFNYVIVTWTGFVLWWLRFTCGISHEIEGIENLEQGPGVLLVKHQSTWDALFSQTLVSPQATVIKRTLLYIPFFGWAFWVTNPIAINRTRRVGSIRRMIRMGKERFGAGFWITMFPEGTRVEAGQIGRFQSGAAMLAIALGAPVFVVAHNGGHCWQLKRWLKTPGTIQVRISPPLPTKGKTTQQVSAEAEEWMREAMAEIDPERYRD